MVSRARIGTRYGLAVTALTRSLLALLGLIASMGLNASTTRAEIAGRDRLMGTVAVASKRALFGLLPSIRLVEQSRGQRRHRQVRRLDRPDFFRLGSARWRSRTRRALLQIDPAVLHPRHRPPSKDHVAAKTVRLAFPLGRSA